MSATVIPTAAPSFGITKPRRIESIDLLRGIVMIIMALDHVRDFFHGSAYLFNPTDLTRTSVFIFFTRWITHFCAPVFVFLAGTSARLQTVTKSRKDLSLFLLTRGLWLVLAEISIVTFGWTFNPFFQVLILQVIWAIGVSMIILSFMIYLPGSWILVTGIVLMAANNLLDKVQVTGNNWKSFCWALIHNQGIFAFGRLRVMVGYPLPPWIGLMLTGYCFGKLYLPGYDAVKRKKILVYLGWGCIVLFVLLRYSNLYGDPQHWSTQRNSLTTFLSFLNTSKYPPSLLYLLMTIGPSLLFLAYAEAPLNSFTRKVSIFGRVPLFFYLIHIYLIHILAMAALELTGHSWSDMILSIWVTMSPKLAGYGLSLWVVYVIWIGVILSLYPLCRWFDQYKRKHRSKRWLSYL